ncbi:MAG: hypothetical protein Q6363_010075 [Candidatus Njordarchaeota archaeon]
MAIRRVRARRSRRRSTKKKSIASVNVKKKYAKKYDRMISFSSIEEGWRSAGRLIEQFMRAVRIDKKIRIINTLERASKRALTLAKNTTNRTKKEIYNYLAKYYQKVANELKEWLKKDQKKRSKG